MSGQRLALPVPLHDLAQRVGRLRPDWQRPERFYAARDDLAESLASLASVPSCAAPASPAAPTAPARQVPELRQDMRQALRIARLERQIVTIMAAIAALSARRPRGRPSDPRQIALPLRAPGAAVGVDE